MKKLLLLLMTVLSYAAFGQQIKNKSVELESNAENPQPSRRI
jgi:hypothetical protein